MIKLKSTSKYITTKGHLEWDGEKYVAISDEGYWWSGAVALAGGTPTIETDGWRFYADGTETGSVAEANENTDVTLEVATVYQVRWAVSETGSAVWTTQDLQLEYNLNSAGWNDVNATSSVVQSAAGGLVEADDTTDRITGQGSFQASECQDETDGLTAGTDRVDTEYINAVWSFQILAADVVDTDTIQLRITDDVLGWTAENQALPTITVNEAAAIDHVAVGALLAQSATIAGTALSFTIHDAVGALDAQSATIDGTADRETIHDAVGALDAQSATIDGTALSFTIHDAIGALLAQDATIDGTALSFTIHDAIGALLAQDATIDGTALSFTIHDATGALDAQSATIDGTAARSSGAVTHDAEGVLTAQDAVIDGTALSFTTHDAVGALDAQSAVIAGTALSFTTHDATGALTAQDATIAGTAARSTGPVTHDAVGALVSQSADIAGTAANIKLHDAVGALIAQSADIAGTATHVTIQSTVTVTGITGGQNLTGLDYCVFDGQDISSMTILAQGTGETTSASGDLVIDLGGTGVLDGDPLLIMIGDWTLTPAGTNRTANCYADAVVG